jgi:hypothetical protein
VEHFSPCCFFLVVQILPRSGHRSSNGMIQQPMLPAVSSRILFFPDPYSVPTSDIRVPSNSLLASCCPFCLFLHSIPVSRRLSRAFFISAFPTAGSECLRVSRQRNALHAVLGSRASAIQTICALHCYSELCAHSIAIHSLPCVIAIQFLCAL